MANILIGVVLCFGIGNRHEGANTIGEETVTNHATGTFEVKLAPQDDKSDDKTMGRMTIEKTWHGDFGGTSKGQMLTGGDPAKGSAGYVAMEKVTGTLKGKKGLSFFSTAARWTAAKVN